MCAPELCRAPNRAHFDALDGWRGVCACLVALYHFQVHSDLYTLSFIRSAYLFVDFFFVLSGFVITASYGQRLANGNNLSLFMLRRLARLYPLHLFVLAFWILLELLKLLASQQGWGSFIHPPFSTATSLDALWLNLFMLHSMGLSDELSWNYPSWSISAELIAYLCFGLATWWFKRAWLLFLGITIVTPWLIYHFVGDMFVTYDFGYLRGLYGFFCGVFIYKLYRQLEALGTQVLTIGMATLLESAVIVIVVWFVSTVGHGPASILAPLLFAPVVLLFAFEAGAISKLLRTAPMLLIGALSYSLYMVHALVQEGFGLLFLGVLPQLTGQSWVTIGEESALIGTTTAQGNLLHLAMLGIVIAVSYLTYHWVELPGQRRANAYIDKRIRTS